VTATKMTAHRSVILRRTVDGKIRLVTPMRKGDTAYCTPAMVNDYLAAGFELTGNLDRETGTFPVRYVGPPKGSDA